MNRINIPGFTADASLRRNRPRYQESRKYTIGEMGLVEMAYRDCQWVCTGGYVPSTCYRNECKTRICLKRNADGECILWGECTEWETVPYACTQCAKWEEKCRNCEDYHGPCTMRGPQWWWEWSACIASGGTACSFYRGQQCSKPTPSGYQKCCDGWFQYPWVKECDDGFRDEGCGFCLRGEGD